MEQDVFARRLESIDRDFGDNASDAIDWAFNILLTPTHSVTQEDMDQFFLATLFAMPLPRPGAADELITFFQSRVTA